ncbi:MAG: YhcH/YjgK/YiaL family protein [Kiritimatiellae bacterium]|nr:YhcH/YjgK/YiaL family protein [Kiritimatiellia bacterium]
MMPSDQFVLFYNEIFKLLEKKGPGELRRYYDRVAERQEQFCLPLFRKGLKGIHEYRERIRIEENCKSRNILADDYLEGGQLVCPSLSKALKSAAGACEHYCDHCPGWTLPVYAKAGFHCVYDIISRKEPECYMFITRNRDLAEDKLSERLAMNGADLVSSNLPIGMVRGRIADSAKFEGLHPRFPKAFAFLRSHDLSKLPLGRNEIDGDDIYANVMDMTLKPWDTAAKLEVHRRYFDIHVPITGDEVDGYIYDEANVKANAAGFVEKDDYVLFRNPKMRKVNVAKGEFAIFYPPYGAHAPNKTDGAPRAHRKLVVKVRI